MCVTHCVRDDEQVGDRYSGESSRSWDLLGRGLTLSVVGKPCH